MRRRLLTIGLWFFSWGVLRVANAQSSPAPTTALDPLFVLEGPWVAKTAKGDTVTALFRAMANGSVLEEVERVAHRSPTITMYAANNVHIVLTHYDTAGNQPRMQTAGVAGPQTYEFAFVDITNLSSPLAGHMQRLMIQLVDSTHFNETWTWREKGADKPQDVLHFERPK